MTLKEAIEQGAKKIRYWEDGDVDHIAIHDRIEGKPRQITAVYKDGDHITLYVGPLLRFNDEVEVLE